MLHFFRHNVKTVGLLKISILLVINDAWFKNKMLSRKSNDDYWQMCIDTKLTRENRRVLFVYFPATSNGSKYICQHGSPLSEMRERENDPCRTRITIHRGSKAIR